jgi:DNA-binding NtrC family response regulator
VEQQEVKPVGATESVRIDARLVAATNKDLAEEVRAGRFREDLLYRLNVVHVTLPPLRERREDIPALAAHFLRRYARESGKTITEIAPETMLLLEAHAWPGNVRELENVIARAVAMSRHAILLPHDLPSHVAPSATVPTAEDTAPFPSLDELTRRHLVRVLAATGGNKKRTAEILGVDRRTLYRMLERYAMFPSLLPPEA